MAIEWVQIGVQTGLIGVLLVGFLLVIRLRMSKWVSLGFARMMKKLQSAAEDEGIAPPSNSSPGISLGGFKITPELVQQGIAIFKSLKDMGILKGGSGSGGGGW